MKNLFTYLLLLTLPTFSQEEKPNIIWLMAEDMGIDLECYGAAGVQTPNLNRMALEGAIYKRAYCNNPICSPNRSAMMIGVDQTITNSHHHRSNRDTPLPEPFKPITYWLRKAGYTTLLGHDLVMGRGMKTDCNFQHKPTGPWDGKDNFGLFDSTANFSAEHQPFFSQIQLKVTHRGDWWKEVRENSQDPVSLDEIQLPPYFADTPEIRYDWAAYLDQVEYMDNEVGLLLNNLKEQGLDKNTVVIFIADNGRCNLRGKGYLQQPGIHIPMIIWAPGLIEPGTIIDDLVLTTDISATVLQLAGAKIPDYLTARPLLGTEEKPNYREYIRSARDIWDEIDECSRSITTKRFKYIENHMPDTPWATDQAYLELNRPALHVMRALQKKGKLDEQELTFFQKQKPKEELYDLESDPHELQNLAEDPHYAQILDQMRAFEKNHTSTHPDLGLADLGKRQPAVGLAAEVARAGVKEHEPELWQKLEAGELLPTHAWMKKYKARKKK